MEQLDGRGYRRNPLRPPERQQVIPVNNVISNLLSKHTILVRSRRVSQNRIRTDIRISCRGREDEARTTMNARALVMDQQLQKL